MQHLHLKTLFWVLFALLLPSLTAIAVIDAGLRVPASPLGIVTFELCGFSSSCDTILNQWGVKGQQLAILSLGLDYLFLIIYPALICVCLLLLVAKVPVSLKKLTTGLAWIALLTGLADALENYQLIQIITSGSGVTHGILASIFSVIKFSILGITLTWLVFISIAYGWRKNNT